MISLGQQLAVSSIDTADIRFVVRRPEYPEWYAGCNEHGPIWTSGQSGALKIRPRYLGTLLYALAEFKPSASIASDD